MQISTGVDRYGRDEVYLLNGSQQVYRLDNGALWTLPMRATQISAGAGRNWTDTDLFYINPSNRYAYIQTLEVSPERRRGGIARELLTRLEGSARKAGAITIWLHVDTENSPAIHLYQAHGYEQQGREEHYYARHRAAYVYSRPLMPPVSSSSEHR